MIGKRFLLFLIFPLLLLLFHNCGKFRSASTKGSLAGLGCINTIQPVFQKSMYKFFNDNNCIDCHREGGASGKFFAHSNPGTAFQVFLAYGSDRVKNKLSLGGGHSGNNYNTNANLKAGLDSAKAAWDTALDNLSCDSAATKAPAKTIEFYNSTLELGSYRVKYVDGTSPRELIPELRVPQVLTWDIYPDLTLQIEVQVIADAFASTMYYLVDGIKARSSTNYRLKNIKVYLNDKNYDVTTFEGIDVTLEGTGSFESLYTGATAVYEKNPEELDVDSPDYDPYSNRDAWSVSLEITQD